MIIAELSGSDKASALGIAVQAPAAVLTLCRKLVEAGHDPAEPLEAEVKPCAFGCARLAPN